MSTIELVVTVAGKEMVAGRVVLLPGETIDRIAVKHNDEVLITADSEALAIIQVFGSQFQELTCPTCWAVTRYRTEEQRLRRIAEHYEESQECKEAANVVNQDGFPADHVGETQTSDH